MDISSRTLPLSSTMPRMALYPYFLLLFTCNELSLFKCAYGATNVLYWSSLNISDNQPIMFYSDEDPNLWIPRIQGGGRFTPKILRGSADLHRFGAISTSVVTKSIHWANKLKRRMQTIEGIADGQTSVTTYGISISEQVNGIATDWINDNVYLTDALYNWIMLTKVRGNRVYHDIIVNTDLEAPHGIAVHPGRSYLFWTDSGKARVERSSLDGSDRTAIVSSGLVKPTALTLDYPNNALYFVDVGSNKLYRYTLDGKALRSFHSSSTLSGIVGLTFHDKYLLGLSNTEKKMKIWEMQGGNAVAMLNTRLETGFSFYDIDIMSSQQQPVFSSPCATKTCELTDICVTKNMNTLAECVCSTGYGKSTSQEPCQKKHFTTTPPSYIFNTKRVNSMLANEADELDDGEVSLNDFADKQDPLAPTFVMYSSNETAHLYMSLSSSGAVLTAQLKAGGGSFERLVYGVYNVTGYAGDWLHDNVYWLDGTQKKIYAAKYNGQHASVILEGLSGHPRALALDPIRRKIYWSEQGVSSSILSCNLDGNGKATIVGGIGIVGQITIDYRSQRLYWTDMTNNKIEYSSLSGSGRQTFHQGTADSAIYGVAIFEDYVAWTDRGSSDETGIHWAITATKEKVNHFQHPSMLPFYGGAEPGYISIYDTFREKFPNTDACTSYNGNCAHLCLPGISAGSRTCKCEPLYSLASDGVSCKRDTYSGGESYLLLATTLGPGIIQISTADTPSMASVPVDAGENPIAIDFDTEKKIIFWTDVSQKRILQTQLAGGTVVIVKQLPLDSVPDGIAVDYYGLMVYYTDTGRDIISRIDYNGDNEKLLISSSLYEPRGIVLRIAKREMYWTDWGAFPKIEKANMDTGGDRELLISNDIKCPNGLTIDHQAEKMFWCDCTMEKVEMANLDGTNRVLLLMETPESAHYFGLTIDPTYVYISDWTSNNIKRLSRSSKELDKSWADVSFRRHNGIIGINSATKQPPYSGPTPSTSSTTTRSTSTTTTRSTTTTTRSTTLTTRSTTTTTRSTTPTTRSTTPTTRSTTTTTRSTTTLSKPTTTTTSSSTTTTGAGVHTPDPNDSGSTLLIPTQGSTIKSEEENEGGIQGVTLYVIAGCAVGGLLIIAATIAIIVCLLRRPCKKTKTDSPYQDLQLSASKDYDHVIPHHDTYETINPGYM